MWPLLQQVSCVGNTPHLHPVPLGPGSWASMRKALIWHCHGPAENASFSCRTKTKRKWWFLVNLSHRIWEGYIRVGQDIPLTWCRPSNHCLVLVSLLLPACAALCLFHLHDIALLLVWLFWQSENHLPALSIVQWISSGWTNLFSPPRPGSEWRMGHCRGLLSAAAKPKQHGHLCALRN